MEACSVLRMPENRDTLCLENDDCIPGMKLLADVIHRYSAVALVQIMLTGLSTMKENRIDEITRMLPMECIWMKSSKRVNGWTNTEAALKTVSVCLQN